jgi:hypothetical protein
MFNTIAYGEIPEFEFDLFNLTVFQFNANHLKCKDHNHNQPTENIPNSYF